MKGKRKRIRNQLRRSKEPLSPKYLASCYGKQRHTKQSAHEAASKKPNVVKPYKCQFCPYYHIGRRYT